MESPIVVGNSQACSWDYMILCPGSGRALQPVEYFIILSMSLITSLDQTAGLLVDAARLSLNRSVLGGGKQKQFLYTRLWKKNKNL